jgi:hypothetical protein
MTVGIGNGEESRSIALLPPCKTDVLTSLLSAAVYWGIIRKVLNTPVIFSVDLK